MKELLKAWSHRIEFWALLLGALAIVLCLCWAAFVVHRGTPLGTAAFGDAMAPAALAAAAVAIFISVLAVLQQSTELKLQRIEIAATREQLATQVDVGKRGYWERRLESAQVDLTRARERLESGFGNAATDEEDLKACFYWGADARLTAVQDFLDECRRRLDHLDIRFEGKEWQENTVFVNEFHANSKNWMFFFNGKPTSDWAAKVATEGKAVLLEYFEYQAESQRDFYEEMEREAALKRENSVEMTSTGVLEKPQDDSGPTPANPSP